MLHIDKNVLNAKIELYIIIIIYNKIFLEI